MCNSHLFKGQKLYDYDIDEANSRKEAQKIYDEALINVDFNNVRCNKCKRVGEYDIKGYYHRFIYYRGHFIKLRILRIECRACKRTHAVLFLDFIPWYSLSSLQAQTIFINDFKDDYLDEQFLYRLRNRYEKFKQLLRIFLLDVKDRIIDIAKITIPQISRQYLQIHKGVVILQT